LIPPIIIDAYVVIIIGNYYVGIWNMEYGIWDRDVLKNWNLAKRNNCRFAA